MDINEIANDILRQENNQLAQAFTMCISNLLLSKGIQPVIEKICDEWNANDDLNKYIIRKEYRATFGLDTTEHDIEICRKFAHELKETFNQEYPSNYPSTKPYFTLENVRKLVDETLATMDKES